MTVRDVFGGLLLALGVLWTLLTVVGVSDVLMRDGPAHVDLLAAAGMLAIGGLAWTWGWLLCGRR